MQSWSRRLFIVILQADDFNLSLQVHDFLFEGQSFSLEVREGGEREEVRKEEMVVAER